MKKLFSTYGNCQTHVISNLLKSSQEFSEKYDLNEIKPIQTIQEGEVVEILGKMSMSQLMIHQLISDDYRIKELSTSNVRSVLPVGSVSLTIPSVYFNGYFPHSASFMGVRSILDHTHDYFIILSYINGMSVNDCISLMTDEDLYTKEDSSKLVNIGLQELRNRELLLDLKLADYIADNYTVYKLFHQFNHPDGLLIQVLANKILEFLDFNERFEESIDNNIVLGALRIPVYKSTYKNLFLEFDEDFYRYGTLEGTMDLDEVVQRFYSCYEELDKGKMMENAIANKPDICRIFNSKI